MPHVKASGRLAHHFWGEYHATIGLEFADASSARDALAALGGAWKLAAKSDRVLIVHGDKAIIDPAIALLVSFGADERKVSSLAKSVDYGEPFEVLIDTTPHEQASFGVGNA